MTENEQYELDEQLDEMHFELNRTQEDRDELLVALAKFMSALSGAIVTPETKGQQVMQAIDHAYSLISRIKGGES